VIAVNIKPELKPLQRAFINLRAKQVPFATSLALNALAKGVAAQETALIDQTFDRPTPFTEKAYRIEVATKARPIALVAAKDIQAQYLEPYVVGGMRSLGSKRAMLAPRQIALNQYGNLPRTKLQTLKGKPNIFIGPIKTKDGRIVNGVWQRRGAPKSGARMRGRRGAKPAGSLKLLIKFEDTTPAPKRLDFYGRAQAYLKKNAAIEFDAALRKALATAR
jgi:hypothetical protein